MTSIATENTDCLRSKRYAFVVLTYNHPEISSRCIESILHLKALAPVMVVHNGSTPQNIKILTEKYAGCEHLIFNQNRGYTGGANAGLAKAFERFENVLFLTNDTEILSLPQHVPEGFCSVTIRKRNTENIDSISGGIDLKRGRLQHFKHVDALTKKPKETFYIPGTAFWINKKTFNLLQGFDESFHTYWDDVDFSYRAHLKNIPLTYSAGTIVKHKIGKTCHKDDFYTYYLFQRNRKKFILKHNLQSFLFWINFLYDITVRCKFRLRHWWRIIYD